MRNHENTGDQTASWRDQPLSSRPPRPSIHQHLCEREGPGPAETDRSPAHNTPATERSAPRPLLRPESWHSPHGQHGVLTGKTLLVLNKAYTAAQTENERTALLRPFANETENKRGNENPMPTPSGRPQLAMRRQSHDARSTRLRQ